MNIECDKCKRQLQAAETGKPIEDSTAWICESCIKIHCTVCSFQPQSGTRQHLAILTDPRCPFCDSSRVHIASQKNIEEWDYFRPKKNNKNMGCTLFLCIAGLIAVIIFVI